MLNKCRFPIVAPLLFLSFAAAGCGDAQVGEDVSRQRSALQECALGDPEVVEVRQENAGAVAPGTSKIYFVTVRNTSSQSCAPATVSFVPDAFMFFSASAQPNSVGGVSSGATAQFRVEVDSDPSVEEGLYDIGFTIVSSPGGSTTGALEYEVDLSDPFQCNRQRPQFSVQPSTAQPVPPGTPQTYRVNVRNIDSPQCGPDTFEIAAEDVEGFEVQGGGAAAIPPNGSADFELVVTSDAELAPGVYDIGFTVEGSRHGELTNSGNLRYQVQQ